MINEEIMDVLENNGINVEKTDEKNEYMLEWWSNAGEDMVDYVTAQNDKEFADRYREIALDFDADDHAEMYVNMRGKNGVPQTIRELIDDADSIQEFYSNVSKEIDKVVYGW